MALCTTYVVRHTQPYDVLLTKHDVRHTMYNTRCMKYIFSRTLDVHWSCAVHCTPYIVCRIVYYTAPYSVLCKLVCLFKKFGNRLSQ